MPDILVGATVKADDFPPAVWFADSTSNLNIGSTTYVAGTPIVAVLFIAPTSGRVLLSVGAGMEDNGGADRVHVAPQIREDSASGSIIYAADVAGRGVGSAGSNAGYEYRSRTTLITGLTPGRTYHAQVLHKVSDATDPDTADIACREIVVVPTF